jgi:hypothetical protein
MVNEPDQSDSGTLETLEPQEADTADDETGRENSRRARPILIGHIDWEHAPGGGERTTGRRDKQTLRDENWRIAEPSQPDGVAHSKAEARD